MVENLDYTPWYIGYKIRGFSANFQVVEEESLVPCRTQGFFNLLRRLAVVQKCDARERIWRKNFQNKINAEKSTQWIYSVKKKRMRRSDNKQIQLDVDD